eukprot:3159995-Rhodomonas_salina.4
MATRSFNPLNPSPSTTTCTIAPGSSTTTRQHHWVDRILDSPDSLDILQPLEPDDQHARDARHCHQNLDLERAVSLSRIPNRHRTHGQIDTRVSSRGSSSSSCHILNRDPPRAIPPIDISFPSPFEAARFKLFPEPAVWTELFVPARCGFLCGEPGCPTASSRR